MSGVEKDRILSSDVLPGSVFIRKKFNKLNLKLPQRLEQPVQELMLLPIFGFCQGKGLSVTIAIGFDS